jgi:signal transduction histidine kinase
MTGLRPTAVTAPATAALIVALIALLYAATGQVGLALAVDPGNVAAIWPASGVALAAVLINRHRGLAGVALGALALNLFSLAAQSEATSASAFAAALGISIGSSLEALIGALLLVRLLGAHQLTADLRRLLTFFAVAAVAALIAATIGVATLAVTDLSTTAPFVESWATWWTGDALGVLVVTPAILTWWRRPLALPALPERRTEALILVALTIGLGYAVFLEGGATVVFLLPPLIVWAAVRFGARGATAAILVASALAVTGTALGRGPFAGDVDAAAPYLLSLFVAVLGFTGLILGSMPLHAAAATTPRAALVASEDSALSVPKPRTVTRYLGATTTRWGPVVAVLVLGVAASLLWFHYERTSERSATGTVPPGAIAVLLLGLGATSATALAVTVVTAGRERAEQLAAERAVDLLDAAEDRATLRERARMAQALHDTVTQVFFTIGLHTVAGEEETNDSLRARLHHVRSLASSGGAAAREAIHSLADDEPLPNLTSIVEDHCASARARASFDVTSRIALKHDRADPQSATLLSSVIREALNNVEKHAAATNVRIELLERPNELRLVVADDGVGVSTDIERRIDAREGFGLRSLRQRVEALGGRLDLVDLAPRGLAVECTLPLLRKAA